MTEDQTRTYPVREDMRFQHLFWTLERVGWILLALIPIAALAGLFSNGFLSEQTAQATNSSWNIEYQRYQRKTVASRFVVRVPAAASEEIRLRLSPDFQRNYEIQSLQPEAARSTASENGLDLFYRRPEQGGFTAVIWATPREFGSLTLRAETSGGELAFPVLIYP